ncbi:MAG: TIGR00282 family metallophosphoesterase [Planctomycetia bacterium]|nr:TIGR00282 family metallophosphoesterase [Planctomycetia bacterium]
MTRILMIGDVVGKPGRDVLQSQLAKVRERHGVDFVIANAENVAGGSGITSENYRALRMFGVDCMTLGDHAYGQKEIITTLEHEKNIVRPGNFPREAPGRRFTILTIPSTKSQAEPVRIAVFCLLGRTFMKPVDCPLRAAEEILALLPHDVKVRIIDFHAEATSDKQTLARSLDGQVSAILGTHTHVATADETIFPGGTAFQCDVGMTGPFDSIIGRRIDRVCETFRTFRPTPFDVARNDVRMNGTIVDVDPATGLAVSIKRIVERLPVEMG